jgi:hypothetical protein
MLVGIGFLTLLIGAVSERFVAGDVEQEVAEAERQFEVGALTVAEYESIEDDLLERIEALREERERA